MRTFISHAIAGGALSLSAFVIGDGCRSMLAIRWAPELGAVLLAWTLTGIGVLLITR